MESASESVTRSAPKFAAALGAANSLGGWQIRDFNQSKRTVMHPSARNSRPRGSIVPVWYLASLTLILLVATPALAQSSASTAERWAAAVDADSLMWHLERLTGVSPIRIADTLRLGTDLDSTVLADTSVRLPDRFAGNKEVARYFVESRLASWGYVPERYRSLEVYGLSESILATVPGYEHPDQIVILGAHLDTVSGAPGADDNGSGVVGVLEAARILSGLNPRLTVRFAFWDLEEAGLLGSRSYAKAMMAAEENIVAVINLDMIGWEGDGWRSVLLSRYADSEALASIIEEMAVRLALDLELVPGMTGSSDHQSFHAAGFPAVMLSEHYGSDFNPYYHSPGDRVDQIDVGYMANIVRLAVAATGVLAYPEGGAGVATVPSVEASWSLEGPFPNPAAGRVRFELGTGSWAAAEMQVYDVMGRSRDHRRARPGSMVEFDVGAWPAGTYFLRVVAGGGQTLRPFLVVR